jgi:hypothetical protein
MSKGHQPKKARRKIDLWTFLRDRPLLVLAVVLLFTMPLAFWATFPANPPMIREPDLPLSITLVYPRHIARDDEGTIDMTVTNVYTSPLSGTVQLVFQEQPPVTVLSETNNVLKLESLPPGGKQTLHLKYVLALSPAIGGGFIEFSPRAEIEGFGQKDYSQKQTVDILAIPRLSSLLVLVVLGTLGLLGDQLKQRLFPSK